MKLNFIKMNPTENMTIFILDPLPRDYYIDIAKKVMDYNSICAEQVGFLERTKNDSKACLRLQMMGGEFCGNATRALAAALVYRNHCGIEFDGNISKLKLEVSGSDKVIECEVKTSSDDKVYQSSIMMPLHNSIKSYDLEFNNSVYSGQLVKFTGIMHYVIKGVPLLDRESFFYAFKNSIATDDYDALGIMYLEEDKNFITPLVYVKETDSLVWERGCGSGSTAVGIAYSYLQNRNIDIEIEQPGGALRVTTSWVNNHVNSVRLDGEVNIVAEGILQV